VQSTIASSQSTRITLDPISINSWVIRIFKSTADTNNFGSASYSINSSNVANASNASTFPNNANYSSSSHADRGKFTITLTNLAKSRFNYFAKVYVNGENQSIYSEEFTIGQPPGIPVGTIWAYMGDGTDLDDLAMGGWYLCRGQAISSLSELTTDEKNELEGLFTRSNKPNPTSLPDLRGMFLRGADESSGNDPNRSTRTGGDNVGSYQDDNFREHNHSGLSDWAGNHDHDLYTVNDDYNASGGSNYPTQQKFSAAGYDSVGDKIWTNATEFTGNHRHGISWDGGNETRPKNVSVNYIIKCRK
jgi:hypothetical protein